MRPLGALCLLSARGLALWIYVPAATLVWAVAFPAFLRRDVSLAKLLGWVDCNVVALLQRGPFRWAFPRPVPWVAWSEAPRIRHRINLVLDPW